MAQQAADHGCASIVHALCCRLLPQCVTSHALHCSPDRLFDHLSVCLVYTATPGGCCSTFHAVHAGHAVYSGHSVQLLAQMNSAGSSASPHAEVCCGRQCNRRVCLAIVPAAESLCQTSIWNYARYFLVLRHRQVLYRRQATSKFAHGGYQCSQSREQLRRISSRCQHFQPCVRRSHTCECTYCLKPDCSTEQLRELLH